MICIEHCLLTLVDSCSGVVSMMLKVVQSMILRTTHQLEDASDVSGVDGIHVSGENEEGGPCFLYIKSQYTRGTWHSFNLTVVSVTSAPSELCLLKAGPATSPAPPKTPGNIMTERTALLFFSSQQPLPSKTLALAWTLKTSG